LPESGLDVSGWPLMFAHMCMQVAALYEAAAMTPDAKLPEQVSGGRGGVGWAPSSANLAGMRECAASFVKQ